MQRGQRKDSSIYSIFLHKSFSASLCTIQFLGHNILILSLTGSIDGYSWTLHCVGWNQTTNLRQRSTNRNRPATRHVSREGTCSMSLCLLFKEPNIPSSFWPAAWFCTGSGQTSKLDRGSVGPETVAWSSFEVAHYSKVKVNFSRAGYLFLFQTRPWGMVRGELL